MSLIAWTIYDDVTGAPKLGALPGVTANLLFTRNGVPRTAPTLLDLGGGSYGFQPTSEQEAEGLCYFVDFGPGSAPRRVSGAVTTTAAPFVVWHIEDLVGGLWTGVPPTVATYSAPSGPLPSLTITPLTTYLFVFTPRLSDLTEGATFVAASPTGALPYYISETLNPPPVVVEADPFPEGETPQVVEGLTTRATVTDLNPEILQADYLTGLNFVDQNGNPYPSSFWIRHINNAVALFERFTNIHVLRRTHVDEQHDYDVRDYQAYAYLSLYEYPVCSVERVAIIYPTGQFVTELPLEWVRLTKVHGQIQLVPTQGTLSQVILGQGGSYLPLIYQGLGALPKLFHIDYTSGFKDGQIPFDIVDAIMKLAAINVLSILGATIFPPGVSNISAGVDGLSQGVGLINNGQAPPVFAGIINSYRTELWGNRGLQIVGQLPQLRDQYKGLLMQVV